MRKCKYCDEEAANNKGVPVCQVHRLSLTRTCDDCGITFQTSNRSRRCTRCAYRRNGKPRICTGCGVAIHRKATSNTCRLCWAKAHSGENASAWKGGKVIHEPSGYVLVKLPDHPNARSDGYVREHIVVAAETLGRPLYAHETVHHRNGIKTDNRPENLQVVTRREHALIHGGKLTEDAVLEIRTMAEAAGYRPGGRHGPRTTWANEAAARFGVTVGQIYRVVNETGWKSVDSPKTSWTSGNVTETKEPT